ncbi:MAG TPA: EamA family transporter RarD [Tepidisphaeraceae bacterium]|jgi:chloramphenicol-sensitive protein RarD
MSTLACQPAARSIAPGESRKGLAYGLGAYVTWGLAPVYYKLVAHVPPIQILAHRVFWSVIFLLPLIAYRGLWSDVARALRSRRTLPTLIASTIFISTNWFTFIYSVTTGQVVQSSLGYFMNPLVVVLLGVFFLKERLRPWQIVSLILAAVAVAILTIAQGRLPVISLILAFSFAFYGFVRKLVNAGPMVGLFVETIILLPLAGTVIGADTSRHGLAWSPASYAILAGSGVMTAVPLLWFANAAKRLRLSTLGLLQYLTPTGSFLLAVFAFGEPLAAVQKIAFPMIWVALAIYSIDSYRGFVATTVRRTVADEEPVLSDL